MFVKQLSGQFIVRYNVHFPILDKVVQAICYKFDGFPKGREHSYSLEVAC